MPGLTNELGNARRNSGIGAAVENTVIGKELKTAMAKDPNFLNKVSKNPEAIKKMAKDPELTRLAAIFEKNSRKAPRRAAAAARGDNVGDFFWQLWMMGILLSLVGSP
ncbi:hypothetical protein ON010_g14853 [Phytophthora cinnamomi]|nr:hypothetical protein ON010_g14853 [Phytophthora cinnamomi]